MHARADQVRGSQRAWIQRFGIRSYVAVRLGSPGRPLGVLFVNYTLRRRRFSRPELAFLETLTSYLSVTIERARLVSVLREAVTSLQAAVLPASFPTVPGLDAAALATVAAGCLGLLVAAGLARKGTPVKVLGHGEVSVALEVRAHAFSATAASKITAAGGTVEVV